MNTMKKFAVTSVIAIAALTAAGGTAADTDPPATINTDLRPDANWPGAPVR
ncbi:hypothetical protein OH799_07320 [Nocardia sp. NBC_00881]|uniref:hypothetical protein n=1 Tax=Nocardia sp. NBC_00881 TaxID=2975995 RepID=UPI00386A3B6C|nr:hypothetical protein OH799_07320 [Nocardia sp. NBC_00881]